MAKKHRKRPDPLSVSVAPCVAEVEGVDEGVEGHHPVLSLRGLRLPRPRNQARHSMRKQKLPQLPGPYSEA